MVNSYHCFTCRKVLPLVDSEGEKCPSCGGTRGEVISSDQVKEGVKHGVYFNIDPKTGKRSKKKPR